MCNPSAFFYPPIPLPPPFYKKIYCWIVYFLNVYWLLICSHLRQISNIFNEITPHTLGILTTPMSSYKGKLIGLAKTNWFKPYLLFFLRGKNICLTAMQILIPTTYSGLLTVDYIIICI